MMNAQSPVNASLLAQHEGLTGTEQSLSQTLQNGTRAVHKSLDRWEQDLSLLLKLWAQSRARQARERELQAWFEATLWSVPVAAVLGGVVGWLLR